MRQLPTRKPSIFIPKCVRLPLDVSGHVLGRATDDEAFGPVVVPRGEAVAAARQLRSNVGFLRELRVM